MNERAVSRRRSIIDKLTSRRDTLGALAGAGLTVALAGSGRPARAQKRKTTKCQPPDTKCGKTGCCGERETCLKGKCLQRCRFTFTGNKKILKDDCIARNPIKVRDGITFDGDGHTIYMLGTASSLPSGVRTVGSSGSVRNLTLDGSGLSGSCAERGVGIQFSNASGSIRNTTFTKFSNSCGEAIRVIVGGGTEPEHTLTIDKVSVENAQLGVNASAINKLTLNVSNSDMKDVNFGIQVQYNMKATIDNNTIDANTYGVVAISSAQVDAAPDVTATDNTVTGAQIGMSVAADFSQPGTKAPKLVATGNTIVGPGSTSGGATHGLAYNKLAEGSANNNRISNFFNSGANVGCGIFVAADAGTVNIGSGNTFPPPGNEQDVCEN